MVLATELGAQFQNEEHSQIIMPFLLQKLHHTPHDSYDLCPLVECLVLNPLLTLFKISLSQAMQHKFSPYIPICFSLSESLLINYECK